MRPSITIHDALTGATETREMTQDEYERFQESTTNALTIGNEATDDAS